VLVRQNEAHLVLADLTEISHTISVSSLRTYCTGPPPRRCGGGVTMVNPDHHTRGFSPQEKWIRLDLTPLSVSPLRTHCTGPPPPRCGGGVTMERRLSLGRPSGFSSLSTRSARWFCAMNLWVRGED
jgi:hypothetical protein